MTDRRWMHSGHRAATLLPSSLTLPDTHVLVLPSQPHSLAKYVMSM